MLSASARLPKDPINLDVPGDNVRWSKEHAVLEAIAEIAGKVYRNSRATPPAMVKPIKQALAVGGNPNVINLEGHDCFQMLGDIVQSNNHATAIVACRYLIDSGYRVIDNQGLKHLAGPLMEKVLLNLAQRSRKGVPILGEDGSNYLHSLAEVNPKALLEQLAADINRNSADRVIHIPSLKVRRASDGQTPMHLLWSRDEIERPGHTAQTMRLRLLLNLSSRAGNLDQWLDLENGQGMPLGDVVMASMTPDFMSKIEGDRDIGPVYHDVERRWLETRSGEATPLVRPKGMRL